MKKIIFTAAVMLIFTSTLTSCRLPDFDYKKITGYDTVGVVEKNSDDEEDLISETVLTNELPNLTGEYAFAECEIIGRDNGKTYAIVVYGGFDFANGGVVEQSGGDIIVEYDYANPSEYKSITGEEFNQNPNGFLPDGMLGANGKTYSYYVNDLTNDLYEEAREYFVGD